MPVVQLDGDVLVDETLAFDELKLDIFFLMDPLPQFGHTTSVHDSLVRSNSSKG